MQKLFPLKIGLGSISQKYCCFFFYGIGKENDGRNLVAQLLLDSIV